MIEKQRVLQASRFRSTCAPYSTQRMAAFSYAYFGIVESNFLICRE